MTELVIQSEINEIIINIVKAGKVIIEFIMN